jgi:hypothetical protein
MRSRFISLPLCGAAVTFFAAAKKVTKESSRSARRERRWSHVTSREWISHSVSALVRKGLGRVLGCPRAHSLYLVRLRFVPASRCALGRRVVSADGLRRRAIKSWSMQRASTPSIGYAVRRARSARRMNDAEPEERVVRGGGEGSARKASTARVTLRGCSIQGKPSTATLLHRGPHSCFLWLLSLQQQRK